MNQKLAVEYDFDDIYIQRFLDDLLNAIMPEGLDHKRNSSELIDEEAYTKTMYPYISEKIRNYYYNDSNQTIWDVYEENEKMK